MNPPFTRPTNHEAGHSQIPNPAFAGFGTSKEEQRAMSRVLRSYNSEFGSGHAGLASNFMDFCHRKLKNGGILGLVLPFTFARGKAWESARRALSQHYRDIHIVSIAATGQMNRAFSADTGIAECLLIATKSVRSQRLSRFSSLRKRPTSLLQASLNAKSVTRESTTGDILEAGLAGVVSSSVIEAASALTSGQLRVPRRSDSWPLKICRLEDVADRGLVDREIGNRPTSSFRNTQGAFDILPNRSDEISSYPSLWGHNADLERRLVVEPDTIGIVRDGMQSEAVEIWEKNSIKVALKSRLSIKFSELGHVHYRG